MDIPPNIYQVLTTIDNIDEGIKGNNIKTGPNQYAYFHTFLDGEAKRQFKVLRNSKASLTTNSLKDVKNELISYFCPKDVLIHQQAYMRYNLERPANKSVREFVYAATTLNDQMSKLPCCTMLARSCKERSFCTQYIRTQIVLTRTLLNSMVSN